MLTATDVLTLLEGKKELKLTNWFPRKIVHLILSNISVFYTSKSLRRREKESPYFKKSEAHLHYQPWGQCSINPKQITPTINQWYSWKLEVCCDRKTQLMTTGPHEVRKYKWTTSHWQAPSRSLHITVCKEFHLPGVIFKDKNAYIIFYLTHTSVDIRCLFLSRHHIK